MIRTSLRSVSIEVYNIFITFLTNLYTTIYRYLNHIPDGYDRIYSLDELKVLLEKNDKTIIDLFVYDSEMKHKQVLSDQILLQFYKDMPHIFELYREYRYIESENVMKIMKNINYDINNGIYIKLDRVVNINGTNLSPPSYYYDKTKPHCIRCENNEEIIDDNDIQWKEELKSFNKEQDTIRHIVDHKNRLSPKFLEE